MTIITTAYVTEMIAGAGLTKIVEMLRNDNIVIDNHDGKEMKIDGFAILASNEICPLIENTPYFSMSGMRISRDSKVHISQGSVGGTVRMDRDMKDAIEAYNNNCRFERHKVLYWEKLSDRV